ncbi:MAG: anthranilate synthase family protein [Nocardioidaceae bacterium]
MTIAAARAALEALLEFPAWAVIRQQDADSVTLLGGTPSTADRLADVPLEEGPPDAGRRFDRLLAIPFRQAAERGYDVHDDGTPLIVLEVESEEHIGLDDLVAALPDMPVEFEDRGGFDSDDTEYAAVVAAIIRDEIGNGEGANLVVARPYTARLRQWDASRALTVLRRLLERERGAYWTYCLFTGERFLIGASPERHVSVTGDDVRMNPISGTFRLAGLEEPATRKEKLLDFLADEKEIYELFMVVDEELKMMCDICNEGGQVLGPFLKPMTHLVHTEYLLAGRTNRDVRDVLRDTMYAATVTGSPVRNAFRLIKKYEPDGRGYYGAALALLGRDGQGRPTADSPIVIRSADVSPEGELRVLAGATLVRDSDPASEVAETRAKAAGILAAFGLVPSASAAAEGIDDLTRDEDVRIALGRRNARLSTFWLTDQSSTPPVPELKGRTAVILDGDDDFVNMLRHLLGVLGMGSTVVRHADYQPGCLDGYDLVILGPGPGDPRDPRTPKIATFRAAADALLASGRPFLAVCLGHQVLCDRLGIDLAFKDIVFQGTQSPVLIGGREENVGFYNTFVGRVRQALPPGVTVAADPVTGDVHLVRGPHFRGVQFHAESILTEHGYGLVHDLVLDLLT